MAFITTKFVSIVVLGENPRQSGSLPYPLTQRSKIRDAKSHFFLPRCTLEQ